MLSCSYETRMRCVVSLMWISTLRVNLSCSVDLHQTVNITWDRRNSFGGPCVRDAIFDLLLSVRRTVIFICLGKGFRDFAGVLLKRGTTIGPP